MVGANVYRFDPARDEAPGSRRYEVATFPDMSVLDLLFRIVEEHDATLSFRFSCRVGMCGSCAMLINGREALACQTRVARLGREITIRPLNHLPVRKDLLVELGPFFATFERARARSATAPAELARVLPDDGDVLSVTADCVSCGACYSACAMVALDREFLGPAALYRALRSIEDKREDAPEERLAELTGEHGIWRCHAHMDCVAACPKGLPLTGAIMKLRRLAARRAFGLPLRRGP